jgi:hypothetical protein
LAQLPAEDQVFVAAFVRCHGSIKQMEKYFGVSYPTVKNRLNRIGSQLSFVEIEQGSDVDLPADAGRCPDRPRGRARSGRPRTAQRKRGDAMSEETRKVLEMLSSGKVSAEEQLLHAVGAGATTDDRKAEPRYFRILVNKPARDGKKAEAVNIRVPMTVVRGGLRSARLPGMLGKKKIQLITALSSTCPRPRHGPRGDDRRHRRAHGGCDYTPRCDRCE